MNKEYLLEKLKELKQSYNAVILAHNYQNAEIQDVADFVGDSFELSRKAAKTDAEVIVFCGVKFMAESAKILSPNKKVLLPVKDAGCPMADMIDVESLKKMKERYPRAKVVTYVNSSASVKAESYVCCTSSNAVNIVEAVDAKQIIFAPDKNLGSYVKSKSSKEIILWDGYCPTHNSVTVEDVKKIKDAYSDAKIAIHPECKADVLQFADYIGSTAGILNYAKNVDSKRIIIGTEEGLIHRLKLENPDKEFVPLKQNFVCSNMKKTTLEDVVKSLENMEFEIEIPEEVRSKAQNALSRMLEMGSKK
jgi:quinolinate synthase